MSIFTVNLFLNNWDVYSISVYLYLQVYNRQNCSDWLSSDSGLVFSDNMASKSTQRSLFDFMKNHNGSFSHEKNTDPAKFGMLIKNICVKHLDMDVVK
jgi:hypothetical protein